MEEQDPTRRYRPGSASSSSAAQMSYVSASTSADIGRNDGTKANTVMSPNTSGYASEGCAASGADRCNTRSAPWPNTAFLNFHQPEQHTFIRTMPGAAMPTGTPTSTTLYPHLMNDNWLTPESASMIGPPCVQPNLGSPASHADPWRMQTSSSHSHSTGHEVMTLSPLRSSFAGLGFDEPAPSAYVSPNLIQTPLDHGPRRHGQFDTTVSRHQTAIQNYPSTMPRSLHVGRGIALGMTSYSEFANQGLVGTYYPLPFAMEYVDRPSDGRGVHLETVAPTNVQTREPTSLSHRIHQTTEGSVPGSTVTQVPPQPNFMVPYTEPLAPRRAQARATFISGGGGLDIRMHDPEFRVAPHHNPHSSQAPSSSANQALTALDPQYATTDKGKGKAASSGTNNDHARPSHGNEASASTLGRKASGVVRKVKKVLKRASAERPTSIVCPFADCGETFSNLHGTIDQHVQTCRSREVQELRDSRSGWSRLKVKPSKTIRCPTCGRGRTYKTLTRWTEHLKQMHGEWLKYDCTIQGCGATFVSVRDCNEHMNSEHQS